MTPYDPVIEEDGSVFPVRNFDGYRDSAAHAEAIRSALDKIISTQKHFTHFRDEASCEDETGDLEDDEDNAQGRQTISFKEHRKAHYDEFPKVKELLWRNESLLDADDDENDESEDKERCTCSYPSSDTKEVLIIDGDDEILRTIDIQDDGTSPPRPSVSCQPRSYRSL